LPLDKYLTKKTKPFMFFIKYFIFLQNNNSTLSKINFEQLI
jgi:hypothetical protein